MNYFHIKFLTFYMSLIVFYLYLSLYLNLISINGISTLPSVYLSFKFDAYEAKL